MSISAIPAQKDVYKRQAQRRRFLLYALDGLSLAEIGVLCGCSKVAVYQSVEAVRKKFINFFENRLNE